MRPVLVLTTMAVVAGLGYLVAPSLAKSSAETKSEIGTPDSSASAAPVTDSAQTNQAPRPPLPTRPQLATNAKSSNTSLQSTTVAAARTSRPATRNQVKRAAAPISSNEPTGSYDDITKGTSSAAPLSTEREQLAAVTGLTPAARDKAAPQAPVPAPLRRAPAAIKPRWVNELSGNKAHIFVARKPGDDGCPTTGCVRPDNSQDIRLVGAVAKTDAIIEHPTDPFEGKLVRGNYVNETPAVYLK